MRPPIKNSVAECALAECALAESAFAECALAECTLAESALAESAENEFEPLSLEQKKRPSVFHDNACNQAGWLKMVSRMPFTISRLD
jgi:hypothetical protein